MCNFSQVGRPYEATRAFWDDRGGPQSVWRQHRQPGRRPGLGAGRPGDRQLRSVPGRPPPTLICSVNWTEQGVAVSAPYATAVLNGRRVFSAARDPQTEIWFMLYAQATQADGASQRNILLGHAADAPLGQGTAALASGRRDLNPGRPFSAPRPGRRAGRPVR